MQVSKVTVLNVHYIANLRCLVCTLSQTKIQIQSSTDMTTTELYITKTRQCSIKLFDDKFLLLLLLLLFVVVVVVFVVVVVVVVVAVAVSNFGGQYV